jgi:hypothetical protein
VLWRRESKHSQQCECQHVVTDSSELLLSHSWSTAGLAGATVADDVGLNAAFQESAVWSGGRCGHPAVLISHSRLPLHNVPSGYLATERVAVTRGMSQDRRHSEKRVLGLFSSSQSSGHDGERQTNMIDILARPTTAGLAQQTHMSPAFSLVASNASSLPSHHTIPPLPRLCCIFIFSRCRLSSSW